MIVGYSVANVWSPNLTVHVICVLVWCRRHALLSSNKLVLDVLICSLMLQAGPESLALQQGLLCSACMQGAWGETHRRLVQHFCDLSEALLAAGCPPIELRVSSKDRAAVACAEPTHIPGARLFEMDLPDWAEPHLR